MTLLTAHKILIASAIAMFVFYAGVELRNYTNGDADAWLRSLAAAGAAVGMAIYLRWFWVHRSTGGRR